MNQNVNLRVLLTQFQNEPLIFIALNNKNLVWISNDKITKSVSVLSQSNSELILDYKLRDY